VVTFSEEEVNQLLDLLKNSEKHIKRIRSILKTHEKSLEQSKQNINQILKGEKGFPLRYGEKGEIVGYYSAPIRGDKRVIKLVPFNPVQWNSDSIQWFIEKTRASSYHIDTSFHDCIAVEIPTKRKYSNILNQAALAFHAMNYALKENQEITDLKNKIKQQNNTIMKLGKAIAEIISLEEKEVG
jgi:hypothetical protein